MGDRLRTGRGRTVRMCGVAAITAIVSHLTVSAEQLRPSPASALPEAPTWSKVARLSDGRVLVTDGSIVLDAEFTKPATLPTETVPSAWLQSFLASAQPHEVRVRDLTHRIQGTTAVYSSPTGMLMNPKYVDYLRYKFGEERLRFRYNGTLDPIQVIVNSAAVGALMPMEP